MVHEQIKFSATLAIRGLFRLTRIMLELSYFDACRGHLDKT